MGMSGALFTGLGRQFMRGLRVGVRLCRVLATGGVFAMFVTFSGGTVTLRGRFVALGGLGVTVHRHRFCPGA